MLLVLHVGYSLWTSPLLIRRLAVRRGSLKARGVLLWGGTRSEQAVCSGWDAGRVLRGALAAQVVPGL